MKKSIFVSLLIIFIFLTGCNQQDKFQQGSEQDSSKKVLKLEQQLKEGDQLGGMTIESIKPLKDNKPFDWEENARITFIGKIALSGTYEDYDPEIGGMRLCDLMFVVNDKNSLSKIPFSDNKTVRFCFQNEDKAKELLKKAGEATIVIDNYIFDIYPAEGIPKANIVELING